MFRSKLENFKQEHIYLLAIIILAAFIRLWNLEKVPIFYDEGLWCYWGLKIFQSDYSFYSVFYTTVEWSRKPFLSAFLYSLSYHVFGINLFAARFISAISGIFSVFILWKLTKELYNEWITALVASVFLSISVFHVWYSRLAMQEALLTFLIMISILAYFMGVKQDNDFFLLLGGVLLGLAINTKQNGAIVFIIIVLFLAINRKYRHVFKKKSFWISLVIAIVIHSPYIYWAFTHNFDIYRSPGRVDIDLIQLFSIEQIYLRILYLASWTQDFLGWPMLILTLLIIPIWIWKRKEEDYLIIIWIAVVLLSFWPAVNFYPRYLVPAVPSIYIASSRVVVALFEEVKSFHVTRTQQKLLQSLVLIFIVISIIDTSTYLFGAVSHPSEEKRLPNAITYQFFESSFAGSGLKEAAQFLKENNYSQDTKIFALPYSKWSIAFLTEDYYPAIYDMETIYSYFENNATVESIIDDNVCVFLIRNYEEEYYIHEYQLIGQIPNTHLEKIIYVDDSPEVHIFVKNK
ncbi:MAG: ArnT family glycosyltransferase [Promethearchaeota archaeon]